MTSLLQRLLPQVQKPARYTGGEYNEIKKAVADVRVRVAFCFPDTYEIGMSNIGMRILYGVMNQMDGVWCERVFAPWSDMEEVMRKNSLPLWALESQDPVKEFDMIAEGFKFCDDINKPISFLQDFDQYPCNIVMTDGEKTWEADDLQVGVRITRDGLISLAEDESEKALQCIKADVTKMALAANKIMEADGFRRMNTICPTDLLSAIGSMAEIFDLILNQSIPLRDRFAVLEDGVDNDLYIYERFIKTIVNGYAEEDD